MNNKYNARGQYIDSIFFASTIEVKAYYLLKQKDPQLIVHPKLTLIEKTKNWKGVTWYPDFYLPSLNKYFETKGTMTEAFKLKMQLLHFLNPDLFDDIIFVFKKPMKWGGITGIGIDELGAYLKNLTKRRNI